ncbi:MULTISPECIES: hypothetical protein [unclassified Azospirillum]|uniref:hypothetical protein n=1 Tax=unclassified Azospirillum TaxID=2630922 RepID=UPI000B69C23F|nr:MULTISPECIES: hypothetical protein [unclassified Azospirillum]SNS70751.1 hypothetical protein SAMN05880591_10681 [Azospirillum sp. RU37A]
MRFRLSAPGANRYLRYGKVEERVASGAEGRAAFPPAESGPLPLLGMAMGMVADEAVF